MMAPRIPVREDTIQANVVAYLRTVLSSDAYLVFAIPNGGARGKAEAARMKATGTLAGIWDIEILGYGGRTWRMETKTDKGRLSKPQEAVRAFMVANDVPHVVVRGIDDAAAALKTWGLKTRVAEASAGFGREMVSA